jgi:hypothetical protein
MLMGEICRDCRLVCNWDFLIQDLGSLDCGINGNTAASPEYRNAAKDSKQ